MVCILLAATQYSKTDKEAVPKWAAAAAGGTFTTYAVWAVDFMSDTYYEGHRFWVPNILDEGVREGLTIEIDTVASRRVDDPGPRTSSELGRAVPGDQA